MRGQAPIAPRGSATARASASREANKAPGCAILNCPKVDSSASSGASTTSKGTSASGHQSHVESQDKQESGQEKDWQDGLTQSLRHRSVPDDGRRWPNHRDLQAQELHLPAGHQMRRGLLHPEGPGRTQRGVQTGQGKGRRDAWPRRFHRRRMPGRPSALSRVGAGLHRSHRGPRRERDNAAGHARPSRAVGALHGVPPAAQQPDRGGSRRPAVQFEREAPRPPAHHAGPGRPGSGAAHGRRRRSARR